jgi:hypothetical protein
MLNRRSGLGESSAVHVVSPVVMPALVIFMMTIVGLGSSVHGLSADRDFACARRAALRRRSREG